MDADVLLRLECVENQGNRGEAVGVEGGGRIKRGFFLRGRTSKPAAGFCSSPVQPQTLMLNKYNIRVRSA